jgi:hypothetical protein
MCRIHYHAGTKVDANVRNAVRTIAAGGPEDHITLLGFGAGKTLAQGRVVLRLSGARNFLVQSFANGILSQTLRRD